jgi:hypothetical protein
MRERGERFKGSGRGEQRTDSSEQEAGWADDHRGDDEAYVLPRSLRSVADAPKDGAWGKIGHSGRDDK